jgi:hypothetical protein
LGGGKYANLLGEKSPVLIGVLAISQGGRGLTRGFWAVFAEFILGGGLAWGKGEEKQFSRVAGARSRTGGSRFLAALGMTARKTRAEAKTTARAKAERKAGATTEADPSQQAEDDNLRLRGVVYLAARLICWSGCSEDKDGAFT